MFRARLFPALLVAVLALPAAPVQAQEEAHLRAGISILGTSMVALVLEHVDGKRGLELSLGTWTFRDVSLSAVARYYHGDSALRPTVGAGLWTVVAPPRDGERAGFALVARFPVGLDWRMKAHHYLGLDVNLNRALWLRRVDLEERPMRRGVVPIPGLLYRFAP